VGLTRAASDDYRRQLQALAPQGAAWPREPAAVLTRLLQAWADELARVDGRAADLVDETHPATTSELLPEWEAAAGLVLAPGATEAERRAVLVAHLAAIGGQSVAYFRAIATAAGYPVAIVEPKPFMADYGEADHGEALDNARCYWLVQWTDPAAVGALQTLFRRIRPAHTQVFFEEAP
jgi:uncharacterized protein YmfQ (DUF2313 family)